jgi:hypothetical protein
MRDADILKQLGGIGVLRTAAKLGSDTRFASFTDVLHYLERQLVKLPGELQLANSRELAASKIRAVSDFIASLRNEGVPELF